MNSLFEQTRDLLYLTGEAVYCLRKQNYHYAYQFSGNITNLLQNYLGELQAQDAELFLPVLSMALDAMEERDGVRLADIYEEGLMPLLYEMQQKLFEVSDDILTDCWGKNRRVLKQRYPELYRMILECRENVPDTYQLSWARTGDLALEVTTNQGTVRINSMCNPWLEARLFTEHIAEAEEYLVIGFGLGFHVAYLLYEKFCNKVIVLENDLRQLAIALSYRDVSSLLAVEKLEIVYCPTAADYSKYLSQADEKRKVCIWYPSVRAIADEPLREMLENYQIELSSMENMGDILRDNFQSNLLKGDEEVSVLKEQFRGKKVLFAAAGPSLDDNMELLRQRDASEYILVCVGKIAKKLIAAGIRPDYIVMTDGLAKTRWRIQGIEDCGVPLIYLSTAAVDVVRDYQGKRYIAFQEGFPEAEKYAQEHGYSLFQTGGSVATFALDMLIQFACRQVICVGLDMGYPGEQTHAEGVGNQVSDKKHLRKVEGITSEYVYTSKTLDIYRRWIEKRIEGVKGTEFVNISKGARIHGMKEKCNG